MKKILSLALAAMMVVSVLPVAYAAETQDYTAGTNVTVIGDGGEYYVTVPATLEPGQTGTVTASGYWENNVKLIVTAPEEVMVHNTDTLVRAYVNVSFDGIASYGNDTKEMNIPANISIDKGDIKFGEWTGTINYTVTLDESAEYISFIFGGWNAVAIEGMTFREWLPSDYNKGVKQIDEDHYIDLDGQEVSLDDLIINGKTYTLQSK